MDQTPLGIFRNIPDKECASHEDMLEYFLPLARRAADTGWGLPNSDRAQCALLKDYAVLVDQLETIRDTQDTAAVDSDELDELRGQVATLRMQLGRAKKKIEKLEG
jgi:hypothetical protein